MVQEDDSTARRPELEQIRHILIGQFAADVDARFGVMEEKIEESINRLHSVVVERTEAISNKLNHEIDVLQKSLVKERSRNQKDRQELQGEVEAVRHDLQQQVGAMGQTLAATEKTLRDESNGGLTALRAEIRQQMEATNAKLQSELSRLDGASVTRSSFRDALRQLSNQFDSSDA